MTKRRRMFDIEMPAEPVAAEPRIRTIGAEPPARRGPMAAAIAETAGATRERQEVEAQIRAENDALAHEHMRLKRLGLVIEMVPLDAIEMVKLVRDRKQGQDEVEVMSHFQSPWVFQKKPVRRPNERSACDESPSADRRTLRVTPRLPRARKWRSDGSMLLRSAQSCASRSLAKSPISSCS